MDITIKTILWKSKTNAEGKTPVYIRFTQRRKTHYLSTGVYIHSQYWDEERAILKEDTPDYKLLQHQIDTKVFEYEQQLRKYEALGQNISLDALLGLHGKKLTYTLDECMQKSIERLKILGRYNSAMKHQVTLSLLQQFRHDVKLEDIDLTLLNEFELFLRKRGNQDNSIATKFSVLKAVYNRAIAEELFTPRKNPFLQFKVGRLWTNTRKRAITKEEVQRLAEYPIAPSPSAYYMELARDIFLFSYYTAGINYKDMASLQYQDIVNGRLYYTRHKTGKHLNYKLLPQAEAILKKYSHPGASPEEYIFPILNHQLHLTEQQQYNRLHKVLAYINKNLGVLGRTVGIKTPLTTYVARHTYATVLKRSGVNIAIISESLGHSDLSTTQIYLDSFENEQIDEAMKNLL